MRDQHCSPAIAFFKFSTATEAAGLSRKQIATASAAAKIPEEDFEAAALSWWPQPVTLQQPMPDLGFLNGPHF